MRGAGQGGRDQGRGKELLEGTGQVAGNGLGGGEKMKVMDHPLLIEEETVEVGLYRKEEEGQTL